MKKHLTAFSFGLLVVLQVVACDNDANLNREKARISKHSSTPRETDFLDSFKTISLPVNSEKLDDVFRLEGAKGLSEELLKTKLCKNNECYKQGFVYKCKYKVIPANQKYQIVFYLESNAAIGLDEVSKLHMVVISKNGDILSSFVLASSEKDSLIIHSEISKELLIKQKRETYNYEREEVDRITNLYQITETGEITLVADNQK